MYILYGFCTFSSCLTMVTSFHRSRSQTPYRTTASHHLCISFHFGMPIDRSSLCKMPIFEASFSSWYFVVVIASTTAVVDINVGEMLVVFRVCTFLVHQFHLYEQNKKKKTRINLRRIWNDQKAFSSLIFLFGCLFCVFTSRLGWTFKIIW